jgi:prolyl oligopeptidase PreP (S9A serine peptidase family)
MVFLRSKENRDELKGEKLKSEVSNITPIRDNKSRSLGSIFRRNKKVVDEQRDAENSVSLWSAKSLQSVKSCDSEYTKSSHFLSERKQKKVEYDSFGDCALLVTQVKEEERPIPASSTDVVIRVQVRCKQ